MPSDKVNSSKRLKGRYIATAGHHHVGLPIPVITGPIPDADAGGAVFEVHSQPDRGGLFAGDDNIYVVAATEAMISNAEEAVGVRREVDADNLGLFVDNMVDEPRDPGD